MDGGGFRAAAADVPGGKALANHIRSTYAEREKAPVFCHTVRAVFWRVCDRKCNKGLFLFRS